MTVQVVQQGEAAFLELIVAVAMTARLYINDVDLGLTADQIEALDETDMTEATFTGYAAKALTPASWVVTAGLPSDAAYPEQTWTCSGAGTPELVYGWYVTRDSDGALMFFERFANGPYVVAVSGQAISFAPTITLD